MREALGSIASPEIKKDSTERPFHLNRNDRKAQALLVAARGQKGVLVCKAQSSPSVRRLRAF